MDPHAIAEAVRHGMFENDAASKAMGMQVEEDSQPLFVGTRAEAEEQLNQLFGGAADDMDDDEVAIVLGTAPTVGGRWSNPFFTGRIATARSPRSKTNICPVSRSVATARKGIGSASKFDTLPAPARMPWSSRRVSS